MFRQFISLTLLVSLVALSSSGIMMILLGSFEFQLQMHPVHKIFGILLTLSGAFHVYYNFAAIELGNHYLHCEIFYCYNAL